MKVTLADAYKALSTIVSNYPANQTGMLGEGSGCAYAVVDKNGFVQPSCIVGVWLHTLGLLGLALHYSDSDADPRNRLSDLGSVMDQEGACPLGAPLWTILEEKAGVFVDEDAKYLFHQTQVEQDGGETWTTALHNAVESVKVKHEENNPVYQMVRAEEQREAPLAEWERELLQGDPYN